MAALISVFPVPHFLYPCKKRKYKSYITHVIFERTLNGIECRRMVIFIISMFW